MSKNHFVYKEIVGQWVGRVEGTNWGSLVLNIDNNKTDEIGIMFNDQTPSYPIALRSFIAKYPDALYKGNLSFFRHFDPITRQMINPNDPKNFANGGEVSFKLKNKDVIVGEWKTNIGTNGKFEAKLQAQIPACKVQKIVRWKEFKDVISKYLGEIKGSYYFRGHQASDYPLRNSFNRHSCWNLERYFQYLHTVFEDLGRFNFDRYKIYDSTDFGAGLHLAQHHGFPTPLVDWTLSPYIAAYFAFRKFDRTEFDVKSVRVLAFYQLRWGIEHEDMMRSSFISPWTVIKPLNLSLGNNQRAIAQDAVSMFSNVENLEIELKDYLEYYDIDIQDQDQALRELESMGIYENHLFPDLYTACKVHRLQYFGEEPYTSAIPRTFI